MNKLLFIIGLRRSGTSILRKLVLEHPQVLDIKFEPHELLFACRTSHISRYRDSDYHKKVINKYKNANYSKYIGAKIVGNPGIEANNWRWLNRHFPNAKFIFIKRNPEDTYASWYKMDKESVRGVCNYEMYKDWYDLINNSFIDFVNKNKDRSCLLSYENLVENADKEMLKVWNTLKVSKIENLNKRVYKPNNWSVK